MAWQNRVALDMLLAEKAGVCVICGDVCCAFIPNNTAPDGSLTQALEHSHHCACYSGHVCVLPLLSNSLRWRINSKNISVNSRASHVS